MKNFQKHQETLEMAAMLDTGLNYRQIGDSYGIAPTTVGQRFRRSGIASIQSESKVARIDLKRLVHLYASEKLSLARIAKAFGVSDWVIKKALKIYCVTKRARLSHGGKHFDRLQKLKIGETIKIACPAQYPRTVLMSSARRLGMKIFIQPVAAGLFRVTRIDPAENRISFQLARIDRRVLEELYVAGELSLAEIAVKMDVPLRKIRQALEALQIPERLSSRVDSKYTSVLRKMNVGETAELDYLGKRPHSSLHTIADRIDIKISMKKVGNSIFRIKRIG